MQDIMIRIETDDFEAWKAQHYLHASNRAAFGITNGPTYQDIDNPKAALLRQDRWHRGGPCSGSRRTPQRGKPAGQGHRPHLFPCPATSLIEHNSSLRTAQRGTKSDQPFHINAGCAARFSGVGS